MFNVGTFVLVYYSLEHTVGPELIHIAQYSFIMHYTLYYLMKNVHVCSQVIPRVFVTA